MYYLIAYLIIFGTIATVNYHNYNGAVSYKACIAASLFFPLQLLNYLVSYFLSFFGVLWYLKLAFLVDSKTLKEYQENNDEDKFDNL